MLLFVVIVTEEILKIKKSKSDHVSPHSEPFGGSVWLPLEAKCFQARCYVIGSPSPILWSLLLLLCTSPIGASHLPGSSFLSAFVLDAVFAREFLPQGSSRPAPSPPSTFTQMLSSQEAHPDDMFITASHLLTPYAQDSPSFALFENCTYQGLPWQSSVWDFASQCSGAVSTLGQGAKIPHASWPKTQKNIRQKQYCNKLNKDFIF